MVAALAALFLFISPDVASACVRASSAPRPMKDHYWDAVAVCETNSNWQDGGNWAGGLGIALSTWQGYGGYEFANTPAKATRQEQIIIANRISVFGHQTKKVFMTMEDRLDNKPFFRPPAGFFGWGCIKNRKSLNPLKWERKREIKCQKKSLSLDPTVQ
jgi:hypothetical protein